MYHLKVSSLLEVSLKVPCVKVNAFQKFFVVSLDDLVEACQVLLVPFAEIRAMLNQIVKCVKIPSGTRLVCRCAPIQHDKVYTLSLLLLDCILKQG